MSTRGMIARVEGDGFRGVYQHFDSYPSGLGKKLWRVLHEDFHGDVEEFLNHSIDRHKKGWSVFNEDCYCHGSLSERADWKSTPNMLTDQSSTNWLWIEWAYAFDANSRTMAIIEGCLDKTFRILTTVSVDEPEPNWQAIENISQEG